MILLYCLVVWVLIGTALLIVLNRRDPLSPGDEWLLLVTVFGWPIVTILWIADIIHDHPTAWRRFWRKVLYILAYPWIWVCRLTRKRSITS